MSIRVVLLSSDGGSLTSVIDAASGLGGLALRLMARADNLDDTQKAIGEFLPEIVMIDASTPDVDVLHACRQLIALQSDLRVVVLASGPDDRMLIRALTSGASGFLRKRPTALEMHDCIQTITRNRIYIGPLKSNTQSLRRTGSSGNNPALDVLSEREIEVLALLADGLKTREIADSLHISQKTVETHRGHIMQKLNLHSIAELTKFAIKHGLTSLSDK